jgi:type 1 glutamine amidotransferase
VAQQEATLKVTSPKVPGLDGVGESLRLREEWYAMKNFAPDLHVILLQETEGMTGDMYQRPPFPATWARMHGKGRVFFTSFGHRDDIWTNPTVQQIMLGGFAWAMGNAEADVTPNIDQVAPKANQLKS